MRFLHLPWLHYCICTSIIIDGKEFWEHCNQSCWLTSIGKEITYFLLRMKVNQLHLHIDYSRANTSNVFSIRRWLHIISLSVFSCNLPKLASNGLVYRLSLLHIIIFGGWKNMCGIIVWKKGDPGDKTIYASARHDFHFSRAKINPFSQT